MQAAISNEAIRLELIMNEDELKELTESIDSLMLERGVDMEKYTAIFNLKNVITGLYHEKYKHF